MPCQDVGDVTALLAKLGSSDACISMCKLYFTNKKLSKSKGRGTRDQIANIRWIMEKAREFQKNIYFCLIDYAKAFDCGDHNKLWKILR